MPTTFIYGYQDWVNYEGAQEARKQMKVPCEIIRVPQVLYSPLLSTFVCMCVCVSLAIARSCVGLKPLIRRLIEFH